MRNFSVRSIATLGLLVLAACSAAAGDDASTGDEQAVEKAKCGVSDPAQLQAIAKIDAVAESCSTVAGPKVTPQGFKHFIEHAPFKLMTPHHRGRDQFYAVGEPQWVLGKFTYGDADKDLKDEPVDIFLLRGCAGQWEKIGTATTTLEGQHATVEGVEDTGGRVYFQIPKEKELPIGRHRVRMVVGDGSFADQYIEVLPKGAAIFVSDMDGTLTERKAGDTQLACDEESDFPAVWRELFTGNSEPAVHTGVAEAFHKLVDLGYRPLYLTARPEWLVPHTRRFMNEADRQDGRGDLPEGIIHTTLGLIGAINSAAETFKKNELKMLTDKGFNIGFGFGNRPSDVATYRSFKVPFRFYYENPDTALRKCSKVLDLPELSNRTPDLKNGDFRIHSYGDLVPGMDRLGPVCGGAKR